MSRENSQTYFVVDRQTTGNMVDPSSGFQWYEILGSVLIVEWAIIHLLAMVMVGIPAAKNDLTQLYLGLYAPFYEDEDNKKEIEAMRGRWPKMTGRVLLQHALNLWAGSGYGPASPLHSSPQRCGVGSPGCFVSCRIIMLDWGYFIGLDTPALGPIPGQAQTFVVSGAMFCFAFSINNRFEDMGDYAPGDFEKNVMYILP